VKDQTNLAIAGFLRNSCKWNVN